jgi:tetratricopeptide (TPR) repeat protein
VCQNVGDVYFSSGSLPLAIESYRKSLEIAETSNDALGTAAACTMLSNVHCRAGDLQDALAWGKRALSAGEKMDDERRIAWANIMLAQTHFWRGDAKSLLPHLDRANHSFDKIGDFRGSAWINIMRSFHAFLLSDYEQSMEYSRQAVAMAKSSGGFQHELSAQLRVIAESLLKLERYRDAYDLCRQCLDIAEPSGNKLEYGYAFALLAEIYATDEFDDLDEAENYFEKSLMTLGDVGAKLDVARAYAAGARVSLARGDGRARELAEAARKLCLEFEGNLYLRYVEELSSMAQSSG